MARSFNPVDTTTYLDTPPAVDISTDAVTCAIWVRAPDFVSVNSERLAVHQYDGTGIGRNWLMWQDFTTIGVPLLSTNWGGTPTPGLTDLTPYAGKWMHWAVTKAAGATVTLKLYLNGVLDNTSTRTCEASDGNHLIGRHKSLTFDSWWKGDLGDFAIWNAELTPEELYAQAVGRQRAIRFRPQNLKRFIPIFGDSTTEPDLSANRIPATVYGTTSSKANQPPVVPLSRAVSLLETSSDQSIAVADATSSSAVETVAISQDQELGVTGAVAPGLSAPFSVSQTHELGTADLNSAGVIDSLTIVGDIQLVVSDQESAGAIEAVALPSYFRPLQSSVSKRLVQSSLTMGRVTSKAVKRSPQANNVTLSVTSSTVTLRDP